MSQFRSIILPAISVAISICSFAEETESTLPQRSETSPPKSVHQFLDQHCARCHSDGKSKGDFSLDEVLSPSATGRSEIQIYVRALKMLRKGEMPPENEEQPTPEDRRKVVDSLSGWFEAFIDDEGSRNAGPFSRRLNTEELQNDLFDTLGIDRTLYGLPPFVHSLPEDARTDGFDTVGHGLGQSSALLEQYQQFVDRYLTLASDDYPDPQRWRIQFGHRYTDKEQTFYEGLGHRHYVHTHRFNPAKGEKPPQPHRDFSVPAFDLTWQLKGESKAPKRSGDEMTSTIESFFPNLADSRNRALVEVNRFGGLPIVEENHLTVSRSIGMRMRDSPLSVGNTGRYKVRVRCRLRFTDGVEPVRVYAKYFNRSHHFKGRFEQRDLTDEATYSFYDDRPRLSFENPNHAVKLEPERWTVLEFEDYRTALQDSDHTQAGITFDFRFGGNVERKNRHTPHEQKAKDGKPAFIPTLKDIEAHYPYLVEVDYIEVEGPYPLVSDAERRVPSRPADKFHPQKTARDCLEKLLPRIYRKPIEQDDLDLHLAIFENNYKRTKDFAASLRTTLSAAFLSLEHLFISNTAAPRQAGTPLPDHELATRLSLFLWSSTPDIELRAAADRGQLSNPDILKTQVKRLLDHPNSSELSANFAWQWLHLYYIGINEPDPDVYSYNKLLESSMVNESLRFFHEILRNNGSIRSFLDSDWILVDERLAKLYQYKFTGEEERLPLSAWRKIPVSDIPKHAGIRGGLLGQAGILKLTSGSIRTSIVSRGMFILETILDDPPPPPPDNVGEIANAVADLEQKSVREQLEFHRQRPSCNSCHKRIDPLGFALENYGAIGQWRTTETDGMKPIIEVVEKVIPFKGGSRLERKTNKIKRKGHPVDTKAVVMGAPVNGSRELRDLLLTKDDVFARCLVSKLMTYGLGRSLRYQDEAVIDKIVAEAAKDDYALRTIIELIATSESFRTY